MGIGMYRLKPDDPGLQANMFVSDGKIKMVIFSFLCFFSPLRSAMKYILLLIWLSTEPGYYENGKFGIRIEDIVQIVPANISNDFNGRGALTFKKITMCPIQTKLINKMLLTATEVSNIYMTFRHLQLLCKILYLQFFPYNWISDNPFECLPFES